MRRAKLQRQKENFVSVREKVKFLEQKADEADKNDTDNDATIDNDERDKETPATDSETTPAAGPIRPEDIPGAVRVLPPGRRSPSALFFSRSHSTLGFNNTLNGASKRHRSASVDNSINNNNNNPWNLPKLEPFPFKPGPITTNNSLKSSQTNIERNRGV